MMEEMDYELAKQLKDAGFTNIKHSLCENANTNCHKDACSATLEELIEACAEKFGGVSRSKTGKLWIAYDIACANFEDAVYGSTPTEAVARLWLALNKAAV
jgi:hypothetical protein